MYLDKISIVNYKNIIASEYDLDRKINCFVGDNGIGKTNILDSIYHLSAGKSYFNSISSQTINHDQDFMFIDGSFIKNDQKENLICSLKRGKKKTLKRNGKIYKKLSE
ncbi:MAG: AAA family ATPase, partial [Flavobacteriaceae bacterium]|nr:AAA family ATPase [Flavobacteriaceae bacterium]